MLFRLASLAQGGRLHCTALAAALAASAVAGASAFAQAAPDRQPAQPASGSSVFAIYLRGTQIGREQTTLTRNESGWIITSSGRLEAPLDFTINRFDIRYSPDWQPLEMTFEARVRNSNVIVKTSFAMTTAINEVMQNNTTGSKEDQISARTVVMPNQVFGAAEALAVRLWNAAPGDEIPVYVAPAAEVKAKVGAVTAQILEGPNGSVSARRFDLTLQVPDRPVKVVVVVDERRRLVRYELPDAGLLAVREDVSSVAVRAQVVRNPTDADVSIGANGFNLAGTLTTPPTLAGRLRYPGVLLVGGTSPADRDQTIDRVAVFAELARMLADSGHVVLRYDRRGTGQSGGRTDSATLADYAADAASAMKWLKQRDDVDKRHLVIVGHMDGGPVALLAASAGNDIDGVVTIDAAGSSGADLILLQQQKLLGELKLSDTDRQARIELQKKIQAAVVSGTGWDGVPAPMRRQADTPWFKSVLTYDPAKVMPKVKQPILVLHGDLDPTVPASEADRLGELAKARKKAPPSEVVHLPDVTHALTAPGGAAVSPKAAESIASWIKKL